MLRRNQSRYSGPLYLFSIPEERMKLFCMSTCCNMFDSLTSKIFSRQKCKHANVKRPCNILILYHARSLELLLPWFSFQYSKMKCVIRRIFIRYFLEPYNVWNFNKLKICTRDPSIDSYPMHNYFKLLHRIIYFH